MTVLVDGLFAPNHEEPGEDGPLPLTPIIFGAATFSHVYNPSEYIKTDVPEQTLLLALRVGINAIDTSVYYGSSQEVLGAILSKPQVRAEFPRSSYHLLSKCGRYGPDRTDFDYSRSRTLESVQDSLARLKTDYLDVCYLHDVEFVADDVGSATSAGPVSRSDLCSPKITSPRIHGQGDARVLEAVATLFDLKDRGVVRRVGISGYPLATLLRIAHLVQHSLGRPLDLLMSYSHATLQNGLYPQALDLFRAAGVGQLVNASPLSMGLLRNAGPPAWHPAPAALRRACVEASAVLGQRGTTLERVALGFGLRAGVPTAVGFSTPDEVLECAEAYSSGPSDEDEAVVAQIFEKSGYLGWSWGSPPA